MKQLSEIKNKIKEFFSPSMITLIAIVTVLFLLPLPIYKGIGSFFNISFPLWFVIIASCVGFGLACLMAGARDTVDDLKLQEEYIFQLKSKEREFEQQKEEYFKKGYLAGLEDRREEVSEAEAAELAREIKEDKEFWGFMQQIKEEAEQEGIDDLKVGVLCIGQ